jgi:hypothetical protein
MKMITPYFIWISGGKNKNPCSSYEVRKWCVYERAVTTGGYISRFGVFDNVVDLYFTQGENNGQMQVSRIIYLWT